MRLARGGYWGGSPENVLSARVDLVLEALDYEVFLSDYEDAYIELNK